MEKLIILHGALGSKTQFERLINLFSPSFDVYFLEFSGHGIQSFRKEFSVEQFSKEVVDFVKVNHLEGSHVFGFSMGGYVALYTALLKPELFQSIQTLATKFEWSPEISEKETKMLDAERIKEKVPAFAEDLNRRHNDWQQLLNCTKNLMEELGSKPLLSDESLNQISVPVTIMRGSLDSMVSAQESEWATNRLQNASLKTLTDAKHPIEKHDFEELKQLIEANILKK